jgi:hypothetical protein
MMDFRGFAAVVGFLVLAAGVCASAMVAIMRLVLIAIACGAVAVQ